VQLSRDPDQALVLACQDPNAEEFERAFESLYTRYRDRTYSIAYRIVGSSADAMDVLQEAFSILFRKISSFRFDSLFSTWLFRLVVNCAIDRRRNRRKLSTAQSLGADDMSSHEPEDDDGPSPIDAAAANELSRHIHDSLQRLSPKLRAILVLRYLESMSYEELAATLDLSMGTVKSRLARAHLAIEHVLRGTLAPFGYSELAAEDRDSNFGHGGRNAAGGVA
jgi:RNA polymerase sigma-70 factor (ECF subfamily)